MTYTKQQILEWLGSDNTLEEAIDILAQIANNEYTVEDLQGDIKSYR